MTDGEELAALEKALLDESADPVDLPFSLLKSITCNFSEAQEIGRGGFGAVYKGVLPSGRAVAVKKLFERFEIMDKNFASKVTCLAGVKHKNTVRFLGYCSQTQVVLIPLDGKLVLADVRQRLLCFEYLPKGCLADYLSDASSRLEWTTRYQIIKGMCEGVHYLHQQRIIHMDLKLQNVLLDDNMVPRIVDFGLSRRLSRSQSRAITENKFGTMGYMAPEFLNNGEITFKTDIYSLGVVIMEILMGHKECSNVKEVVENWTQKFGKSKSPKTLEQIKVCASIGIKCTNYDPCNRPDAWFIIRGILGEVEISKWSATNNVATLVEGQVSFASKLDDSTAPSQLQPSALEVEQDDGKVRQERKRKTSITHFTQLADELKLMDDCAAQSQPQPLELEVEQDNDKVRRDKKRKASAMSVPSGVMSTLSGRLAALMGEEYNKRKEVRKQVSFLQKELSTINVAIEQLELMDDLAPGVKIWRDDIREISYDMEICIDDFMHQFGGDDAKADFVRAGIEPRRRLCELQQIANQMEELRTLVVQANARRESYKIDDCKPSSKPMDVDPRLSAVYQEATNLVGIDVPREEVSNLLMDTQKKLKVVSVVGFGGLGKTTLAKQVFDKISRKFDCMAFCSVSQRPDMSMLLNRLKSKLGIKESSHNHGFEDIIEELRKYLTEKRYLIVVDDVWDQSAWNTISHAFPENGNGSRIIVTTRVENVAIVACHNDHECIYTMKALNEHDSRILFSNKVFGSEVICPPHLKDILVEILKKCGGLPLAIITIASLLSIQVRSRKHWESIRKSLGAQSAANLALKEMNSILNLSYKHLPLHLRACFLYLGMYPEDQIIRRDDLVKQWIAEGFIGSLHGPYLEDVGRRYFNELINRSMIQPSETEYGEVLSCTVHDMMLELILRKCIEDNFISAAYNPEDMARLLQVCKYKVRRLSLSSMDVSGEKYDTSIAASVLQVRSLLLFNNPIPPLLWFKYLRVLIVIDIGCEKIVDLTAISQLFQLRYVMVRAYGHMKIYLPTVGELVYLETLHIEDCTLIKGIPSDIVNLPRMSYLVLPKFTGLPEGIENMRSLRTVHGFDLEKNSLKCIMGLGELINLRELSVRTDYDLGTAKADALARSIGNLHNLERMCIYGGHFEEENNQQLGSLSNPFQHIERLGLRFWHFYRVPKFMGGLHCLRFLELSVEEMSTEEFHLLGELPSLVHLHFYVTKIPDDRAILGTRLFPVLELLRFRSLEDTTAYLGFEAGAMPSLRTLCLSAYLWGGTIPVGMEHLLHLQEIQVYGGNDVLFAFREASLVHPNSPSVK